MITLLCQPVLISLLVLASFFDIKNKKIPNYLTYTGICIGLFFNLDLPIFSSLQSSLIGMIIGFLSLLPLYILGGMAAGDLKLMAMCGSFIGFPSTLIAVLLSLIFGGFYALITIFYYRTFKPDTLTPKFIPFAPSICCAIIITLADPIFIFPLKALIAI